MTKKETEKKVALAKKKEEHPVIEVKATRILPEEVKPGEVVAVVDDAVLVPADYKSKLTRQQVDLIKNTIAKGASDDELKMFLYVCERTRLDPFTKQIHLVPRWDNRLGREVRSPIVGIDGLRSVAERTGAYAGNDDPIYDDETKPKKATVTVYKVVQGVRVGFTASARWEQYFPGEKQGFMWNKMPHLMLGKCAEALALRKAFPAVMSGLYVAEEMQQAQGLVATQGNQSTAAETDFDKALRMIKMTTDAKGLAAMKSKIEASEKYTAAEKNKIGKAIDTRVAELTPKVVAKKVEKDDPTLPTISAEDQAEEDYNTL